MRELLKEIRHEARLTQKELAEKIGVSTVLIAMLECGSKKPSKKFIKQLAKILDVSAFSIAPLMFETENYRPEGIEKRLYELSCKLKTVLITDSAKKLRKI